MCKTFCRRPHKCLSWVLLDCDAPPELSMPITSTLHTANVLRMLVGTQFKQRLTYTEPKRTIRKIRWFKNWSPCRKTMSKPQAVLIQFCPAFITCYILYCLSLIRHEANPGFPISNRFNRTKDYLQELDPNPRQFSQYIFQFQRFHWWILSPNIYIYIDIYMYRIYRIYIKTSGHIFESLHAE